LNHARTVVVADFNVDGWMDVLASGEGSDNEEGELRWWRNTNNGTVFVGVDLTGVIRPRDISLIDYDVDGDTDALVTEVHTGDLYFYRNMLGTPAYVNGTITAAADGSPLADVMVSVRETGSYDYTDANGDYQIDTAPGSFTVDVSHPCWNDTFVTNVETEIGEFAEVTLALTRPQLELPNSSLTFFAMNNLVTTVDLPVINLGNGVLVVTADVSGNFPEDEWLDINPDSASVLPGETFTFSVSVSPDTTDAGAWDYTGDIELTTNSCPDTVVHIAVLAQILDAENGEPALPERAELYPAYPNPFNSSTVIKYALPQSSDVRLVVYDTIGRQVSEMVYENKSAGIHTERFNAAGLSSGVYFVVFNAGNITSSQKLLFVK
jgi:hypothetical protein